MGYSLTEPGMGVRNLSGAGGPETKGRMAPGLELRKLWVRPLDLEVLEEPPPPLLPPL